jgi:RNA 2',3'-cyclic 3'-phosphodiesterase
MQRLFVAVTPPEQARADLYRALAPVRDAPGAPRWTTPDRWHLTLLFLGRVPAEVVGPLADGVGPVVAATPSVTLRLAGGGRFGSRRRPQVCWAGVAGEADALAALAVRLAGVARTLGLPVEDRPFRPHLTLGRWRPGRPGDGDLPDRLAGYRGPSWPLTEVELLESHLGAAARYERVAAWTVG